MVQIVNSHIRCKSYTVIHNANCMQSYTVQIVYSHIRCNLYTVIHNANCMQSYTVQILYGHIQCKLCTVLAIPMYYLGQQRRALKLSSITGITFSSDIHISLAAKQHKSRPFYSSKALNSSIPSLIFLPTHALLISSTGRGLSI